MSMITANKTDWIDGMIWIGESYKKILCTKKESCGIPVTKNRNKCYVHEAEWRGCCRKVPDIPNWLVPGKSRIFLAHRDNSKAKDRGSIFGYFVLERIEMIRPPEKVMPLEINPVGKLQLKRMQNAKEEVKPVLEGTVYRADNGKPIEKAEITAAPLHRENEGGEKTFTDRYGYYKFKLAVGYYSLTAAAPGFQGETVAGVEITYEEKYKQDFYLLPETPDESAPNRCEEGEEIRRRCWDGSTIATHRCVDGKWMATGEECPTFPDTPPACEEGDEIKRVCWDGSEIVTHRCMDGKWVRTDETCPEKPEGPEPEGPEKPEGPEPEGPEPEVPGPGEEPLPGPPPVDVPPPPAPLPIPIPIPIDITMYETHRSCSLRFIPAGIYLVDALTADVTDRFVKEMGKSNIQEKYKESAAHEDRKKYIAQGNEIFKKILIDFRTSRVAKTVIPAILKDKAGLRGELVLFRKPLVFKSYPQAAFMGLRRVDGDSLVTQLAEGAAEAEIAYHTEEQASPRDEMLVQIAKDLKINQATVDRTLKKFIELFKKELKEEKRLAIPGLGVFSVKDRKARKGRNPQTGAEILIKAKKAVTFRAAKSLKDEIE